MSTQEIKSRKITIDYTDANLGVIEVNGTVHHIHEYDGSETILIRTEPSQDVKDFLHNKLVLDES